MGQEIEPLKGPTVTGPGAGPARCFSAWLIARLASMCTLLLPSRSHVISHNEATGIRKMFLGPVFDGL